MKAKIARLIRRVTNPLLLALYREMLRANLDDALQQALKVQEGLRRQQEHKKQRELAWLKQLEMEVPAPSDHADAALYAWQAPRKGKGFEA